MAGGSRNAGALLTAVIVVGGVTLGAHTVGATTASALQAGCTQSAMTVTCTYTSGSTPFTVPAGVTSIHVHAVGGNGAGATSTTGRGGVVEADLAPTAGTVLTAVVNAGGGASGTTVTGGGTSYVYAATPTTPLVVAAGGGGAGQRTDACLAGPPCPTPVPVPGGNAGYPTGGSDAKNTGPNDGQGGTQSAGGAGGQALTGNPGGAGGLEHGGSASTTLGGGGGAGLYGGGGGGDVTVFGAPSYGSGGGGSDYAPAGGTFALTGPTDTPEVVITYVAPPAPTVTFTDGPAPGGTAGTAYSFTFTATSSDGSAPSFASTGGTLPPGLALSSAGVLSGTPTSAGTYQFTVTASAGAGFATQAQSVAIAAAVPAGTLTPTSLDFGSVNQGSSATKPVTLSSTGTAPLAVTSIVTTGADFSQTNNCPTTLAVGSSCTIMVTFSPSTAGSRSGTVSVTDNAPDSPQTASLSGTGVAVADVAVSAAGNPNAVLSGGSLTYTVTVINHGPQAASGLKLDFALSPSVQFANLSFPSAWTCTEPAMGATGTISCTAASLASGTSAAFTIGVKAVAAGKTNVTSTAAVATSGSSDTNTANNTASVTTSVKGGQK